MTNSNEPGEIKIDIRLKLSALWASAMFCYLYGDFFTLFVPGRIKDLMQGNSGVGPTTPWNLLAFAILMTLPSLMVFLSLILPAKLNRWTNIIIGILFTVVVLLAVMTSIDKWMMFYTYLGIIEILITSLIVFHAWRWSRVFPRKN